VQRLAVRPFPGGRPGLLLWRKGMVVLSAMPGNHTARLIRLARRVPAINGLDEALAALGDADIVHAFNVSWEAALVAAHATAGRDGLPLVITPFAHLGAGDGDRVARNSTMQHQLHMLRGARRVLTLTEVERAGLAALGVPEANLAVIGGGADDPPADFAASPYYPTAGRDWPEPYAVFIGRLSYDKGAIHAAQAVLRAEPPRTLVLIGTTTPEFDRFYRGLSNEQRARVRPLGVLPEVDKHAILAGARCLLLPSRSDSFGIVMLEAWGHGRPVIAARAGGIPGVVDDGVNGLLVPFGDVDALAAAVGRLLSDGDLADVLGQAGRDKARRDYSWDAVAERVLGHYLALHEPA
jgi:glycosyltransferase involved in cell wall biosynthesis